MLKNHCRINIEYIKEKKFNDLILAFTLRHLSIGNLNIQQKTNA